MSVADTGSHRLVNKPSRRRGITTEFHCARCGVVSRWMEGHERRGVPAGWEKKKDVCYCLSCRRARATEEADAAAGGKATLEERAKIRTVALIEFEIDRDPDRPNGEIAKVVRCSVPAVLKARKRLEDEAK
jgi:rubredoxin